MKDGTTYAARGVSSGKAEVLAAVAKQDPGLFPGAFCKVLPDDLTGDPSYCLVMHADGSGTKAALAYIAWREQFGLGVWDGIIQDSLIMNLDDLGCVGGRGPFVVSTTINRNKHIISGDVIATIIGGCERICAMLGKYGVACTVAGGETADVPDLVRTITVDNTIICRMRRSEVVDASRMVPGDLIVGFSSTGRADWEKELNTGIGANGFTNARHDVLMTTYAAKYPETFAPQTPSELVYRGKYGFLDVPRGWDRGIGMALLSPTRTYLPLIKALLDRLGPFNIHGLIHCSGGGQTKIAKFGQPGNRYVKDHLFPVPPLFKLLKDAGLTWEEMFKVYNMGHRLEAVVPSMDLATFCIREAMHMGIDAQVVGHVEEGDGSERSVVIKTEYGTFSYS